MAMVPLSVFTTTAVDDILVNISKIDVDIFRRNFRFYWDFE